MYIGNILIPYIDTLSTKNISKDVNIKKILSSGLSLGSEDISSQKFTIGGTLCPYNGRSVSNFSDDVEAIAIRNAVYNRVKYESIEGFLSVEDCNIPNSAENLLAKPISISGNFFPLANYQSAYQVELDYILNDYEIDFPPLIALPVDSYNVRIKSAWDTLALSNYGKINGIDGDLHLYKPFDIYDELNYDSINSTGEQVYLEAAHGCLTLNLDSQTEFIQWDVNVGVDIPKGLYKYVFRIRDDDVENDIKISIIDSGSSELIAETFSTGGSDWVKIETSQFQLYNNETIKVKIEKLTADTNVIEIDYGFFSPETIDTIVYDTIDLYDIGEIKVYDTNGESSEQEWDIVYDINHVFDRTSGIVIRNSLMEWKIDLDEIWANTGDFKTLSNGEIGRLYPLAFSNNNIVYSIKQIKQDLCVIYFYMANGDSDYNADESKEIAVVSITPYNFKFELIRYGTFNSDWFLDLSDMSNFVGSYCPNSQFVSSTSDDLDYSSKNSSYLTIFDDSILVFNKSIDLKSTIKNSGGYISLSEDSSENYMFSFSIISGFNGSEYLFKSDDLSYSIYNTLDFETFVSEYDSTMFSDDLEDSANWSWSTDHLNISSGVGDTNSIKILKSYEYKDIDSLKIDVKISEITGVFQETGLIFSYKDSDNYYYAVLTKDTLDLYYLILYKIVEGSKTQIGVKSVTLGATDYHTLDIEIENDTITIYLYEQGTSRTIADIKTVTDSSLTKEGNVGICALADTINSLDFDYQNFEISGDNIYNRGVLKDSILDDLNWDTLSEYIVNEGALTKWSYNSSDLCFDVDSNDSLKESVTLDNIVLGSGNYKCQIKLKSENSIIQNAGLIFASVDENVGLYYSLQILRSSSGDAYLILGKTGSATSTEGTYGGVTDIPDYGLYGYGGIGAEVSLNYSTIDYDIGDWGVIECDYNNETNNFECYYYAKGEDKPNTPNFTYIGDDYYTIGNVGLISQVSSSGTGNLSASFKNLHITSAVEDNAVNGKFLSMGGVPHGSLYNDVSDVVMLNSQLGVLEYAKYNLFIRTKTIDGSTSLADLYYEDETDEDSLSITNSFEYENITASADWAIQNEILNIDEDRNGHIGYIGIRRTNTSTHNEPIFLIDFISLIPINGNANSEYIFPFDLSYSSFKDFNYNGKIVRREFDNKSVERSLATFTDLNYLDI